MTSEEKRRLKNILLDLGDYISDDPLEDDPEELKWVHEALSLLGEAKNEARTYQLNVELQVRSADEDASSVRDKWNRAISDWFKYGGLPATLSAIRCAEVHKFETLHWGPGSADPMVEAALVAIAILVSVGADGGFGEFDEPAEVLVRSRWPDVTDWECDAVTYDFETEQATLHDLYVAE